MERQTTTFIIFMDVIVFWNRFIFKSVVPPWTRGSDGQQTTDTLVESSRLQRPGKQEVGILRKDVCVEWHADATLGRNTTAIRCDFHRRQQQAFGRIGRRDDERE